jgi:hypothetical protein
MLKMVAVLTRPARARRDALIPGKAAGQKKPEAYFLLLR